MRLLHANRALAQALNLLRTRLFGLLGVLAALLALMIGVLSGGTLALQTLYSQWDLAKRHTILMYLPPNTPPEALTPLNTNLPLEPGIANVRVVPPSEVAAALAPVLPTQNTSGSLPLPVVAEIELEPGTPREPILAQLQQTFPLAELDDQQPMLEAVASSVRLLQTLGLAVALALGAILALFMALTIRAGLLAQHNSVALLIQLGATDKALAQTLALQAARPVLRGAAIGTFMAALLVGGGGAALGWNLNLLSVMVLLIPLIALPLIALLVGMSVAFGLLRHA